MAYINGDEVLFSAQITGDGISSGSSVEIVQTTGESTTAVMSQKATTKAIAAASGSGSGKVYNHNIALECTDDNGYGYIRANIHIVSTRATPFTISDIEALQGYGSMIATGYASYEANYGSVTSLCISDGGIFGEFYAENYTHTSETWLGYIDFSDTVIEVV